MPTSRSASEKERSDACGPLWAARSSLTRSRAARSAASRTTSGSAAAAAPRPGPGLDRGLDPSGLDRALAGGFADPWGDSRGPAGCGDCGRGTYVKNKSHNFKIKWN